MQSSAPRSLILLDTYVLGMDPKIKLVQKCRIAKEFVWKVCRPCLTVSWLCQNTTEFSFEEVWAWQLNCQDIISSSEMFANRTSKEWKNRYVLERKIQHKESNCRQKLSRHNYCLGTQNLKVTTWKVDLILHSDITFYVITIFPLCDNDMKILYLLP